MRPIALVALLALGCGSSNETTDPKAEAEGLCRSYCLACSNIEPDPVECLSRCVFELTVEFTACTREQRKRITQCLIAVQCAHLDCYAAPQEFLDACDEQLTARCAAVCAADPSCGTENDNTRCVRACEASGGAGCERYLACEEVKQNPDLTCQASCIAFGTGVCVPRESMP